MIKFVEEKLIKKRRVPIENPRHLTIGKAIMSAIAATPLAITVSSDTYAKWIYMFKLTKDIQVIEIDRSQFKHCEDIKSFKFWIKI